MNTIEEAKAKLAEAIASNQEKLGKELREIRQDLQTVLEHVQPAKLRSEIKTEIALMGELVGTVGPLAGHVRNRNVKTGEKVAFLRDVLSDSEDGRKKTELLNLAKSILHCTPSPTFLDAAIKAGGFVKSRDGHHVVISLPTN